MACTMRETCGWAGACGQGGQYGGPRPRGGGTHLLLLHEGRDEAALVGGAVGHRVDHEVPAEEVHSRLGTQAQAVARALQVPQAPGPATATYLVRVKAPVPKLAPLQPLHQGHLLVRQPQVVPRGQVLHGAPGRGGSEPAPPPPRPPGPAPRRTSSQGRPSCPETGPARLGSARACRCACRPGRSPRAGSRRTTAAARCPPCSARPGGGRGVSATRPPRASPHTPPRHPDTCRPWGVTWPGTGRPPSARGSSEPHLTFSTEVVPTPSTSPPPGFPGQGAGATDKGELIAWAPSPGGALRKTGQPQTGKTLPAPTEGRRGTLHAAPQAPGDPPSLPPPPPMGRAATFLGTHSWPRPPPAPTRPPPSTRTAARAAASCHSSHGGRGSDEPVPSWEPQAPLQQDPWALPLCTCLPRDPQTSVLPASESVGPAHC